jgi:phosphatidylglycerophosphate synthase
MDNISFSKDTDGFFAKHFDRKISGTISRWLLKTPVTPNEITVTVTCIGVLSGDCMAQAGYAPKVIGAFLFLLTSILDGCDGEVARAKQMISRLGGWLDFWGDNVVHVAVFYGLGFGLWKDTGWKGYLTLGRVAVVGTLASAGLAAYRMVQKKRSSFVSVVGDRPVETSSTWRGRWVALSDALARRDFIYLVVALALLGHLEWFLWMCSIGVCFYTAVLVILGIWVS